MHELYADSLMLFFSRNRIVTFACLFSPLISITLFKGYITHTSISWQTEVEASGSGWMIDVRSSATMRCSSVEM